MEPALFDELNRLPEPRKGEVLDFLAEYPELAETVCENLKLKRRVAETGDAVLAEQVLRSEEAALDELIREGN